MANTTAPLSEVGIANLGAQALDDLPLSSLDDNTAFGRLAARQFGYVRDELLCVYPWAFATTRALLAPVASVEVPTVALKPAFGYSYQYQLPDDCLRVREIRNAFNDPYPVRFELEGRRILTDYGTALPLIYTRRVTLAPEFDPLFARLVGLRLALIGAQTVTGKSSYYDRVKADYDDVWSDARMADGFGRGTQQDVLFQDYESVRAPGL